MNKLADHIFDAARIVVGFSVVWAGVFVAVWKGFAWLGMLNEVAGVIGFLAAAAALAGTIGLALDLKDESKRDDAKPEAKQ